MAEPSPFDPKKNSRRIWVMVALGLLLLAIFLHHFTRSVVEVRTATVARGQLISTLSTNGKVEPAHNFAAYSPKSGIVKAVYVHEGEKVSAGQLLLTLDDAQARSDVAQALTAERAAEAQMQALQHGGTQLQQITLSGDIARMQSTRDEAAATLATLQQLEKQGAASLSEVQSARSSLAADNASLKNLERQQSQNFAPIDLQHAEASLAEAKAAYASAFDVLQQENVHAPFAGTIYSVLVRASDFVQAGDKLLQMADLKQIQIRAYFDEPEIGKLVVGAPVKIVWEAQAKRVWHGHVVRTPTTIVTYGTRNVGEALISVDDADEILLPNTNVTITVTLLDIHDALVIPREALHVDDGGDYVYRVMKRRLQKVQVTIGAINLTEVQIVSGLSENAVIALSAPDGASLRNGLSVRRVE